MEQDNQRQGTFEGDRQRSIEGVDGASREPRRRRRQAPRQAPTSDAYETVQEPRRTTVNRSENRAAGVEPAPRGPNRHASRRKPRNEQRMGPQEMYADDAYANDEWYEEETPRRGVRVPLIPALLVLLLCIGATAFATRYIVLRTHGLTQSGVTTTQASTQQGSELTSTTSTTVTDTEGDAYANSGSSTIDETDSTSSDGLTSTGSTTSSSSTTGTFTAQPGDGVKDPWLMSGTYTTGDAKLDAEVKSFCDTYASTNMDLETAALEVYKGVAWSEYVERDDAQHPAGRDWRIEYARKYYEHDCSGNCYEFAAFLSYCLQYLGYTDAHAEGVILEKQSGDWGDHGLVFVTNLDGTPSLCDTSKGTDGWMLKNTVYNMEIQDFENA